MTEQAFMQIGEVSSLTGLSLRSIRYYEEVGLLQPSARSTGGFRLYTDHDVARIKVIMRMKPLGFTLEQMREVLDTLAAADSPNLTPSDFDALVERLTGFKADANERVLALRKELLVAESFAHELRLAMTRLRRRQDAASSTAKAPRASNR